VIYRQAYESRAEIIDVQFVSGERAALKAICAGSGGH